MQPKNCQKNPRNSAILRRAIFIGTTGCRFERSRAERERLLPPIRHEIDFNFYKGPFLCSTPGGRYQPARCVSHRSRSFDDATESRNRIWCQLNCNFAIVGIIHGVYVAQPLRKGGYLVADRRRALYRTCIMDAHCRLTCSRSFRGSTRFKAAIRCLRVDRPCIYVGSVNSTRSLSLGESARFIPDRPEKFHFNIKLVNIGNIE